MGKWTAARIAEFLDISMERAGVVRGLLNGTIHPQALKKVESWVRRCYHEPSHHEQKMAALDAAIGGSGVEVVCEGGHTSPQTTSGDDILVEYVNTGDTYSPTIAYVNGKYRFTTWGDEVERLGL